MLREGCSPRTLIACRHAPSAPPPPSQEGWYLSETETVLEVIFVTLLTATMCVGVQVLGAPRRGGFHPLLELTLHV